MAGAMLSFGGLLSEVLQGGAAGLTASNPGIVKVLGGFVFPVGLVMFVLPHLSVTAGYDTDCGKPVGLSFKDKSF
jgi:formate/nitrite transporter FocA (FNT family)